MSPVGDEDLRRLFEERRTSFEEKAPPFRKFLERERTAAHAVAFRIGRAVMAAMAVVVLVVSVKLFHRPPEIPPARIETWKPPTDFLLEASFTELFDTTPTLPKPVPDYSPLLEKQKGSTS